MKKRIFWITLLCACMILIMALQVSATEYSGTCGANATWELNTDTGVLTISGSGDMSNYTSSPYYIPWSSYRSYIMSVVIENGITSIGNYAFYSCTNTTSITISSSVTTIGSSAFQSCTNLTSVTIPSSITSIYDSAFRSCRSLSSITILSGITSIGDSAFHSCSSLTSVTIPSSVTSIGNASFVGCTNLTSVTIPSSVASIGNSMFSGCTNLTSVTIPSSVTSIGSSAFYGCSSLTSVTIPSSIISIGSSAFERCTSLTSITIQNGITSIGVSAFYGCSNLTNVSIPNSVTLIGDSAFYECSSLASVTISSSVISIGDSAFCKCSSLTSVVIPSSVTSIGNYAFQSCSNLTDVTISNGVTSIGVSAFASCSILTNITIPSSIISIGSYAFSSCSSLTNVMIQNGVTSIGGATFYGCTSLADITIPSSVTSIGGAFRDCSNLTSVTILGNITSIDGGMFYGCSSLKSIVIPSSVTSIGSSAFWGCGSLENIIIPESVTYIGSDAFQHCRNLTNIVIPEGVTSIDGMFWGCSSLKSVVIPSSVTSIGSSAFLGCGSLTSITIPDGVISIGEYAFKGCQNLTNITIPHSVTSIGNEAFQGCSRLTNITMSSGVTSIGYGAFQYCSSLTSVTMPNSVTVIGGHAFYGCTSLTNITLSNNITYICSYTFYGCSSLTSITIPSSVTVIGRYSSSYGYTFAYCSKLMSVYFMGDAPTVNGGSPIINVNEFYNTAPGFTIYYIAGKSGWTTPTWNGYPSATFIPDEEYITPSSKSYNQYIVEEFIEKFYQTDAGIGEQLFFDEYTTAKMIAESESEDFSYFKAWVYNITNDAKTNIKSVLFKKSYYQTEIVKPLIQAILSDIPKNNEITEDLKSAKDNIDEVDKIKSYLDKVYEKYDDHVVTNMDIGIIDTITESKVTKYNYQILRDDKMSELFGDFTGTTYDYLTGVLGEYITYQKIKLSAELIHFDLLAEYFIDDREAYDVIMNLKESYTDEMLALSYYSIEFIMGQTEDKIIDLIENSAEGFLNYVCANINTFLMSIGKGALIPKFTLSPMLKTLSAVDFIRGELFDMTGLSDYASDSKNLTLFYWLNQSIKFDLVHSVYNYIQGDDSYESADKIVALYDLWRGSQIYMNKCAENVTSDIYQKTILEEEINFIKSINIENWRRSKYYANSNISCPDYTELSTSKYGNYYKILLEGYNNDSTSELWNGKDGLLSYWDEMNSYQKYKISEEVKQLTEFSKSDSANNMYTIYLINSNTFSMSGNRGVWHQGGEETSILIVNPNKMGIYIRNIKGDLYGTFSCKTFNILSKEEVNQVLEGNNALPEDMFMAKQGNLLKSTFNGISWENEMVTCVMNSINNYISGKQYTVAKEYIAMYIDSAEYEIFLKNLFSKKYYHRCYNIENEINIIFDELYDVKLYTYNECTDFSKLISNKKISSIFLKHVKTEWFDKKSY